MARGIGVRNELAEHGGGNVRIPSADGFCVAYNSKKQDRYTSGHDPGWQALWGRGDFWQPRVERPFRWANRDAFEATRAFGRLDGDELVDWQVRGTNFGAFCAVNAGLRVAANAHRTQKRREAEQRAVRAQIAAPEVLHQNRSQDQDAKNDESCLTKEAEEIQHLHARDNAIIALHESRDCGCGHRRNRPDKKSEKKIFQSAERNIDPAPDAEVAAEKLLAKEAQVFRNGADGTEPAAKSLAQKK